MLRVVAGPQVRRSACPTAVLTAMLIATSAGCTSSTEEPEGPSPTTQAETSETSGAAESAPAAGAPSTITPGEAFTVTAPDGWQFSHTAFTVSGDGGEILISTSDDGATPQDGHRDLSGSTAEVDALEIEVGPQATLVIPESAAEAGSYQICGSGALIGEDGPSSSQQICAETELAD